MLATDVVSLLLVEAPSKRAMMMMMMMMIPYPQVREMLPHIEQMQPLRLR